MSPEPEELEALKIIKNLKYEFYDPANLSPEQKDILGELGHLRAFHANALLVATNFGNFSLLNEEGWPRICYQAYLLPSSGHMYWITDQHAEMIGRALRSGLKELTIELTTLQGDGFSLMAANVAAEVRLDHLYISHQSADEVTCTETRGLAPPGHARPGQKTSFVGR